MNDEKLFHIFEAEIYSRIDKIDQLLLQFSAESEDKTKLINSLFLEFHSIKGASHIAGAVDMENICQVASDLLKSAQNKKIELRNVIIISMNKVNNTLKEMIKVFLKETEETEVDYFDLLMQIKRIREEF